MHRCLFIKINVGSLWMVEYNLNFIPPAFFVILCGVCVCVYFSPLNLKFGNDVYNSWHIWLRRESR